MTAIITTKTCEKLSDKNSPFLLVLLRGENIYAAISQSMKILKLPGAMVSGLGAVENPTIAYYHLPTKTYEKETYPGIFEIASLNGNVGYTEKDELALHFHIVIGTREHEALAGHFIDGLCGVTVELLFTPLPSKIIRKLDGKIGINLINL